jgi:predicted hotdog family 3-hydroxylacyl-ACP dehydratase
MAITDLPITDISHLIPQKTPFVMVDTLLEFSPERIVSSYKIRNTNLFISENNFLEPGLIENMAQTVALHTGYDYFLKGEKAPTGYIGSIKKVDVFLLPKLNEIIRTEAKILHEFMGVTMVEVNVFNIKNDLLASAEMKTVIAN